MRTRRSFLKGSARGAAAAGAALSSLCAQQWARDAADRSPRRRERVTLKHGGRSVKSLVAYPQSPGKAPGIVVIHEIFGMTDWVENVTDEFAEAGYVAIAPDLLSGMAPSGGGTSDFQTDQVRGAIRNLPPDQITADLNAAADYCMGLPACNGKVSVVGFSWGGGQAFRFATNRRDLSAAFVFYGSGPAADAVPKIQAPVYGFYAGADARIDATVPETQQQMKAAGKSYDVVTYDGATHGFMRAGEQPGATEANEKARAAAWVRLKELRGKLE